MIEGIHCWREKKEFLDKKGTIYGGLEKDFSLVKKQSARKIVKERGYNGDIVLKVLKGPREIGAHKSLERGKK